MLIHHTDCGMLTFNDAEFEQRLEEETGRRRAKPTDHFLTWKMTSATPSSE